MANSSSSHSVSTEESELIQEKSVNNLTNDDNNQTEFQLEINHRQVQVKAKIPIFYMKELFCALRPLLLTILTSGATLIGCNPSLIFPPPTSKPPQPIRDVSHPVNIS
jgi:hypothetical protein